MSGIILTQQISNHPHFPNVKRFVDVNYQSISATAYRLEFGYTIRYIKVDEIETEDGIEIIETDITNTLQQPINKFIYTDATASQIKRDLITFEPLINPDWDGVSEDEEDKYIIINGWELVLYLINNPTVIVEHIKNYILIKDADNYFDTF